MAANRLSGLKLTIPPSVNMEKPGQDAPKPPGPPGGLSGPPGPPGPPGGWLLTRMSKRQEILFNIMVPMLQLIPQSTLTTVFPVSRDIAASFSISNPSVLPWLVAAYATSFGTFILVGGRLGDIFGHKTMVVIGFSWLSFWSVVAGLSHYAEYELFFVARGFQGVGASLMVPNGLALLGRTYPPGSKQKIFAFTLFGLCAPVGAYLGMVFGALFTRFATWYWSFYTLAIVSCLLAIAATFILVSPPPTPKQMLPVREKLRDMDWLGAITGVGGMISIQVALVSAPASGWSKQWIFMLLIIGLLLVAFFVVTELKIAEQPLVPFKMLKPDVGFVLGAVACGWATFGIWTWFLWKFLLGFKKEAPLEVALHVFPIVPVALIASVLTAWMMRKCRPSWTLFWALVAFTFGPLLLALDSNIDKTSYWTWTFASLIVMPFGMDMSFPAATLIMSNYFPPAQQGIAGSLISTCVNYSISIGLGIASTVEVNVNNNGTDVLKGIRGGWFMGVGLGGLGVLICVAFVGRSILHPSPAMAQGPPQPVPAGPGPALQLTPTTSSHERKSSRTETEYSPTTTMVPSTPGQHTPKHGDSMPFENFDFSTMPPPSRPTSSHTSPKARPFNSVPSPRNPKSPTNIRPKTSHGLHDPQKPPRPPRKSSLRASHARSESQTPLNIQPPQSPLRTAPRTALPTSLEAVYSPYSHARYVSDDIVDHQNIDHWDMPTARTDDKRRGWPIEYVYSHSHMSSTGSGSVFRDPDGFEHDRKPVTPHGMMGEQF